MIMGEDSGVSWMAWWTGPRNSVGILRREFFILMLFFQYGGDMGMYVCVGGFEGGIIYLRKFLCIAFKRNIKEWGDLKRHGN